MWMNQPNNPDVNSLFFWNSIFSGRKINRFSFSFRTPYNRADDFSFGLQLLPFDSLSNTAHNEHKIKKTKN